MHEKRMKLNSRRFGGKTGAVRQSERGNGAENWAGWATNWKRASGGEIGRAFAIASLCCKSMGQGRSNTEFVRHRAFLIALCPNGGGGSTTVKCIRASLSPRRLIYTGAGRRTGLFWLLPRWHEIHIGRASVRLPEAPSVPPGSERQLEAWACIDAGQSDTAATIHSNLGRGFTNQLLNRGPRPFLSKCRHSSARVRKRQVGNRCLSFCT